MFGTPVWQRDYFEHIIRDEAELHRIREYILTDPARWIETGRQAGFINPTYLTTGDPKVWSRRATTGQLMTTHAWKGRPINPTRI
jgi:hypothetical protein